MITVVVCVEVVKSRRQSTDDEVKEVEETFGLNQRTK
jgi:hypothetical protein